MPAAPNTNVVSFLTSPLHLSLYMAGDVADGWAFASTPPTLQCIKRITKELQDYYRDGTNSKEYK